jgi:hypothetical protein
MDSVSCTPPYYLTSYRTPSTVISDAVYQVIRGCAYGAVWGMVSEILQKIYSFIVMKRDEEVDG